MENIEGRKEKSVARESLSLSCGFTTVDGSISPSEREGGEWISRWRAPFNCPGLKQLRFQAS